jgi:hypothetical protein
MQNPTDHAGTEASIPREAAVSNNDTNMNGAVIVRRKPAKRTLPFDLAAEPSSSFSPQAEDIPPARKKPRLEENLPTTTDEAARKSASSSYLSVGFPPPAADNEDVNAYPVTDTQPNAEATRKTPRRWTKDEDAELTRAIMNTCKKKHGSEYKTNWPAISAKVVGRTSNQCLRRWRMPWIPA